MQRLRQRLASAVFAIALGLLPPLNAPGFTQVAQVSQAAQIDPAAAQEQQAMLAETRAAARQKWIAEWYWDYQSSLGPPVEADAFVTSATAVRGWSMSLVPSATLDGYGFQLKTAANLFDMLRQPLMTGDGARFLRRSSVEIPFDVLSVVQKSEDRGNGLTDTVLDGTFPRTAAFIYKYTLIGDDIEDREDELTQAIIDATNRVYPKYRIPGTNLLDLKNHHADIVADLVREVDVGKVQRQLKRQLRIAAKASYASKWTDGTRDEWTLGVSATKLLRDADRLPVTANADVNWIHAVDESTNERELLGYACVRGGASADVDFSNAMRFSLGVNVQHFYGDGFSGIRGGLDPAKKTEWNLSQTISFRTAQGHYLGLAIRETHFGTGDRDMSLATEFGFKF
jgi:hypothetical protein